MENISLVLKIQIQDPSRQCSDIEKKQSTLYLSAE